MLEKIDVKSIQCNPFELIGDRWALITAGDHEHYNTMTASWAQVGVLWNKPVATIYIRPQRYTYHLAEESEYLTASFFAPGEYREALNICGTTSGRDHDKFAAAGITPAFAECGAPYVAEADLVLVCKKLYVQDLEADCFLNTRLRDKAYAGDDYHRMYVGHIVEAYQNK